MSIGTKPGDIVMYTYRATPPGERIIDIQRVADIVYDKDIALLVFESSLSSYRMDCWTKIQDFLNRRIQ